MNHPILATTFPDISELKTMAAKFAPTPLTVDTSHLSNADRRALVKLVEVGRVIDDLFMQQLWNGDLNLYHSFERNTSPLGNARLHLFRIYKGPWSDLDEHRAFLPDVPDRKPLGANFYPEDMSRDEFEHWIASLPEKDAQEAKSFFTVIRRNPQTRALEIVPYYRAFHDDLQRAATLLQDAALSDGQHLAQTFPPNTRPRISQR